MEIEHIRTGRMYNVEVRKAQPADLKKLTKKRFYFTWSKVTSPVFVLNIIGDVDVLGAVTFTSINSDARISIDLLACSRENVGKQKIYGGIAGCLIAYACRQSSIQFAQFACVSLIPKTKLRTHYMTKYQMKDAGIQLYLEQDILLKLIAKYF